MEFGKKGPGGKPPSRCGSDPEDKQKDVQSQVPKGCCRSEPTASRQKMEELESRVHWEGAFILWTVRAMDVHRCSLFVVTVTR